MTKAIPALLLTALACAAQTPPAASRPDPYIPPQKLDAVAILPAPPAAGTAVALEEWAELHRIQEQRTEAEVEHAQADDRDESIFAFANVMGSWFQRAALPKTAALSDRVKANESPIVNPAKNFFKRPRPFIADATIKPVCKADPNRPTDYSYPSGHGVTGYLEALVLASLVPEKRDALLSRADDYAHSREVCGVHYPSDEVASKAVAYAIFALMQQDPKFQADAETAARELRDAANLSASSSK
jgi:acid phosphatase (class A)